MKAAALGKLVAVVILSVAGYYAIWGGEYSVFDLARLGRERDEAAGQLAEMRAAVDSLRLHASKLEDDPATLERVARERFGMIRDGELLYRFVDAAPAQSPRKPRDDAP